MPPSPKGKKRLAPATMDNEDACYNCDKPVNAAMMQASVSATNSAVGKIEGREPCSWFEIHYLVKEVAKKLEGKNYDCILGIANGGIIPAKLLAEELKMDAIHIVPVRNKTVIISEMPKLDKNKRYLVIDDIYDTGGTYEKVAQALKGFKCDYAFCMSRFEQSVGVYGRILNHNRCIVFPWELG